LSGEALTSGENEGRSMSFNRKISDDISIEIAEDGTMTITSKFDGVEIALTAEELEEIEMAYEDFAFESEER
jgi:hypothetical protein